MIAATLAATVISSQADVYSQNIVGYVNVPLSPGYNLIANPLDDGAGNQLTNLLASANLANKSSVQTWAGTVYNTAVIKNSLGWGGNATLAPGSGFFVKNSSTLTTNTFSGSVVGASGSSVTNVLSAGYNLVGSMIPFAGELTTDTNLNLVGTALANKSQLQSWNAGSQSFNTAVIKNSLGWGATFPVVVGQGFFIKSANTTSTNWIQTAP